jgi:hypothetical protein
MWRPAKQETNYPHAENPSSYVSVTEHRIEGDGRGYYNSPEHYTQPVREVAELQQEVFLRGGVRTGAEERAFNLAQEPGTVYLAHEIGSEAAAKAKLSGYAYRVDDEQTLHTLRIRELEVTDTYISEENRRIGASLLRSVITSDGGQHDYIRVDSRVDLPETRDPAFFIEAGMRVIASMPEGYARSEGWGTPGSYVVGEAAIVEQQLRFQYEQPGVKSWEA